MIFVVTVPPETEIIKKDFIKNIKKKSRFIKIHRFMKKVELHADRGRWKSMWIAAE